MWVRGGGGVMGGGGRGGGCGYGPVRMGPCHHPGLTGNLRPGRWKEGEILQLKNDHSGERVQTPRAIPLSSKVISKK